MMGQPFVVGENRGSSLELVGSVHSVVGKEKGKETDAARSLIVRVSQLGEESFQRGSKNGFSSSVESVLNTGNSDTEGLRNRTPPIPEKSKLRRLAHRTSNASDGLSTNRVPVSGVAPKGVLGKSLLTIPGNSLLRRVANSSNPSSTNLSNVSLVSQTTSMGDNFKLEEDLARSNREVRENARKTPTSSPRLSVIAASPEESPEKKNHRPEPSDGGNPADLIKAMLPIPVAEWHSKTNSAASVAPTPSAASAVSEEHSIIGPRIMEKILDARRKVLNSQGIAVRAPGVSPPSSNLLFERLNNPPLRNSSNMRETLGIPDLNVKRIIATGKKFCSELVVPVLGKILKAVDLICKNTTTLGVVKLAKGYGTANVKTFRYFEGLAKTCPHAALVSGLALVVGSSVAAGLTGGVGLAAFPVTMPIAAGLLHGGAKGASGNYSNYSENVSRKVKDFLQKAMQPQELTSAV